MKKNIVYTLFMIAFSAVLAGCIPFGQENPAGKETVLLKGNVAVDQSYMKDASHAKAAARTAIHGVENYSFKVTAVSSKGDEVSAEINQSGDYVLELNYGKWTITASALYENGDVLSQNYTAELAPINPVLEKNFILKGVTDGTGKGRINLSMNFPSEINMVRTRCIEGDKAEWSKVSCSVNSSSAVLSADAAGIKSGEYLVNLDFYTDNETENEILRFSAMQVIRVYNNMTTSVWVDDGSYRDDESGLDGLFAGNPLVLTVSESMLNSFVNTTFYVFGPDSDRYSEASDSGSGSFISPQKNLNTVLKKCVYDDLEYRVFIDGTVTVDQQILVDKNISFSALNETAVIQPSQDYAGSSVIKIVHSASLSRIVLDGNTGSCTGIIIDDEDAEVSLTNCTITDFTSNDNGGGINVTNGTLIMKNSSIEDCSSTSSLGGGGGIYCSQEAIAELSFCTIARCNSNSEESSSLGGGGILTDGPLHLWKCEIDSCSSTTDGGGIAVTSSSDEVLLQGTTISSCAAGRNGGGLYCNGSYVLIDEDTVIGAVGIADSATSTSHSNIAAKGGGLYVDVSGTVENKGTISYNYADSFYDICQKGTIK